jgi:hypothetical protein
VIMTEHGNGGQKKKSPPLSSTDLPSLKSREQYVRLSEQKLEVKKRHCELFPEDKP